MQFADSVGPYQPARMPQNDLPVSVSISKNVFGCLGFLWYRDEEDMSSILKENALSDICSLLTHAPNEDSNQPAQLQ